MLATFAFKGDGKVVHSQMQIKEQQQLIDTERLGQIAEAVHSRSKEKSNDNQSTFKFPNIFDALRYIF